MKCNGCGNDQAYRIRGGRVKTEDGRYVEYEVCDRCGDLHGVRLNEDVSQVHQPYFDEHLCDKAHPNGQMVYSRSHKADLLKQLGLREKSESKIPYIADVKKRRDYFRANFGER